MDSYDLCTAWEAAVAANTELNDWISATFGRPLARFVGVNPRSKPGKLDCPYIAFDPQKSVTGEVKLHELQVAVLLGVADDQVESTTNRTEYRGLKRLRSELLPRVQAAISGAVDVETLGPIEAQSTSPEDGYFELTMLVTAKLPKTLG
ncbi:hypothetical protein [Desulfocurvibacter africanus]|uniref:hypothetical protein n=1 Tax=Desulfocurvibacter africanus TaxID=873 RepID=UPI000406AF73|nr:hypothetical protein [Desulfocurvibacter africanus]